MHPDERAVAPDPRSKAQAGVLRGPCEQREGGGEGEVAQLDRRRLVGCGGRVRNGGGGVEHDRWRASDERGKARSECEGARGPERRDMIAHDRRSDGDSPVNMARGLLTREPKRHTFAPLVRMTS